MLQYAIIDRLKRPFIVYNDTFNNKTCVDPSLGMSDKNKIMLITLPNAGIPLFQKMFSYMGLHHVRILCDKESVGDFRFLSENDRMKFHRSHDTYSFPLTESIKWILPGQFSYNNLPYDNDIYQTLKTFGGEIFLIKRNLRNCFISHAKQKQKEQDKFTTNTHRLMELYIYSKHPNELINKIKLMMSWFKLNMFTVLSYEDFFVNSNITKQKEAMSCVAKKINTMYANIDQIVYDLSNSDEYVLSSDENDYTKYWSAEIEEWFVSTGCKDMNKELGYE